MWVINTADDQSYHVQCTPNLATVFIIKTSTAKGIHSISHYPKEAEVLFLPLSQFLVTKVRRHFPQSPDQIYLQHVNTVDPNP
jgi:hypothetical protein